MVEEGGRKGLIKEIMPRIFKAALWGTLTYAFIYYLPTLIFARALEFLPIQYNQLFYLFAGITVFFAVVTTLFSGTILGYAFRIARSVAIIIYFVVGFNGGIVSLTIPTSETAAGLVIDLKIFMAILILLNLLAIGKTMLEVTDFFAKKVEPK